MNNNDNSKDKYNHNVDARKIGKRKGNETQRHGKEDD